MLQLAVVDTFQTNPIVYGGMMYVSTPNLVVALDAVTCAEAWRQEWEGERGGIAAQRGLAMKDGVLVRGTPDGHLMGTSRAPRALSLRTALVIVNRASCPGARPSAARTGRARPRFRSFNPVTT